MRSNSHIRLLLAGALALNMLFMVSFHELHYLFTSHHEHEHCHHPHLHSSHDHFHCPVCKFDISLATDEIEQPTLVKPAIQISEYNGAYQAIKVSTNILTYPLRGPPSIA